ncbi:MAG: 16S rRNA (cytosine(1402)-N(4))-methyltransferase RsmH [Paracoccaceae bacterium]
MGAAGNDSPHVPVLLEALLRIVAPVRGVWLDGTFGAGGYSRALLESGASRVIAIDRDPEALERAGDWAGNYGLALVLIRGRFGELDRIAAAVGVEKLDGVVLDIGVSSMQIDRAERGFSFLRDGPLDMRMEREGMSAADLVNRASERVLADILYQFGEERASRRIARAIAAARAAAPITSSLQLAGIIAGVLPRPRPGQPHPATRSFQALRIAVNDELGELVRGLTAAEAALAENGYLAVVTFHSLEDRIVKRFFQHRSGEAPKGSRHAPAVQAETPRFRRVTAKPVSPTPEEIARNPRARSARLRVARRLAAPAARIDPHLLGLPTLDIRKEGFA